MIIFALLLAISYAQTDPITQEEDLGYVYSDTGGVGGVDKYGREVKCPTGSTYSSQYQCCHKRSSCQWHDFKEGFGFERAGQSTGFEEHAEDDTHCHFGTTQLIYCNPGKTINKQKPRKVTPVLERNYAPPKPIGPSRTPSEGYGAYIDSIIAQSKAGDKENCDKGFIMGLKDGTPWTTNVETNPEILMKLTDSERQTIVNAFDNKDFSGFMNNGIFAESIKYEFLRVIDDREVLGKSKEGQGSINLSKTNQAIVIGHASDDMQAGNLNKAVDAIVQYMKGLGLQESNKAVFSVADSESFIGHIPNIILFSLAAVGFCVTLNQIYRFWFGKRQHEILEAQEV